LSYVSISKPVRDRIVQAARETPTEIIGLLLGRLQDDTIIIEDSTTHEFLSEPHRVMLPTSSIAIIADQLVSGRLKGSIVGWYHSHTEGGLFYSETDIATQRRLQQFSSLITGMVVDSSTGEVGYFRVFPGTNQAFRMDDSNVTVFTDPKQPIPQDRGRTSRRSVAPTPTVEVRRRSPSKTVLTRRTALSIIVVALIVSTAIFASVLYKYSVSTVEPPVTVTIVHVPVSTATVGSPIAILANITGPGRNVTLVYGQMSGGRMTQALMNSSANGEYSYLIPPDQVNDGNIAYYIKAYDPAGRQVNTTTYHIAVADFGLRPQTNALTIYNNRTVALQLQIVPINSFNRQIELSTSGTPAGLTLAFSPNLASPATLVGVNVTAGATTHNGTYPVTIIATYSAASRITRESVIEVTVANFVASLTSSSNIVHAGSTATFTVALTLQRGFVAPVNVTSISGLPHGATYNFTTTNATVLAGNPGSTNVMLQVKIVAFTKMGTYPILIVISGGGVTHSLPAQIIVR